MLIDYDTWAGASQPEALTLFPLLYSITSLRFCTVSYFFHSSLCFLLILPPTQFPSPFFNLIFHVSYPFPCQSPLPQRYLGLQKRQWGETCDAHFSCWSSHLHKLRELWLSRDWGVSVMMPEMQHKGLPCQHACMHTQWESAAGLQWMVSRGAVVVSPV